MKGRSIVADVPASIIPCSLVQPAAFLSTRQTPAVRPAGYSNASVFSKNSGNGVKTLETSCRLCYKQ